MHGSMKRKNFKVEQVNLKVGIWRFKVPFNIILLKKKTSMEFYSFRSIVKQLSPEILIFDPCPNDPCNIFFSGTCTK